MTVNVNDVIASLPAERQAKIRARAAKLIAEEMTSRTKRAD
jgi:adenylate kinase